jgi:hypothetical protein
VTISQQTLTSAQQAQIRTNISAASQADVNTLNNKLTEDEAETYSTFGRLNTSGSTVKAGTIIKIKDSTALTDGLYVTTVDVPSMYEFNSQRTQQITNGGVTFLSSNFTYSEVKSQLTPATGITINSVLKQEIGKLVTVYMYITTSSAITALTEIFSGLPTPTSTQNYVSTFLAHDAANNADTYRMSVRDGGKVQNLDALPNGKVIRATFSYFKN